MRKIISAAAILILSLALTHAPAQSIWTEEKITQPEAFPGPPKFSNDGTIYWVDDRTYLSGYQEIRAWDAVNGERVIRQVPPHTRLHSVYGQTILYDIYIDGTNRDLYIWDPAQGDRAVTTAPGIQTNARMWGDGEAVVFEDQQGPYSQVKIWDPVNGERFVSPTASWQAHPRIYGDTVVWEDGRSGWRSDVYRWNPRDGEQLLSDYLNPGMSPAIYQDKMVMFWLDDPYSWLDAPGLYEYTPTGGLRRLGEAFDPYGIRSTELWGDLVVYQYGGSPSDIGAWDPVHGFTWVNQSNFGNASGPSVYGHRVAWVGGGDVYLSTMVPEPASFIGLCGFGGLLCLMRIRGTAKSKQRR